MENDVSRSTEEWEITLGAQVRRLRQRRSLTQRELSHRANVSLSSLQALETGRGSNVATLIRAVRALEQTIWLDALSPKGPLISPMQELRNAQLAEQSVVKRVRKKKQS